MREARLAPASVIVLGALSAFGPLSLDLYLPGLPQLAEGLDTSASLAQLTLTGWPRGSCSAARGATPSAGGVRCW